VLLNSQHVIEILHGLPGGAFSKIVQTGNDNQATSGFVQSKTDIAEIGVGDMLQLGQSASGPDANHLTPGVKLPKESLDVGG
jgi:hypothetical protein